MKVGYVRVSTTGQNVERQEILMEQLDVERVYIEKQSARNTTERPVLNEMMQFLREGDILTVQSISRFARNTKDLLMLMERLDEKGVQFVSQKENIDTSTSIGKFMLTVFAAIAELELSYIKENQYEGIQAAKAKGVYKGRKRIELPRQFESVYNDWRSGKIKAVQAQALLGLKPNTFYRRVREHESEHQ